MQTPLPIRPSLRDFFNILFKRKAQALLFFFATVCVVAVGTFLMKPTYEATSQILVKIGRENMYVPAVPTGGNNPVVNIAREEQLNSEIEILKSRTLLRDVVQKMGPATIYPSLDEKPSGILSRIKPQSSAPMSTVDSALLQLEKDLTVSAVKKSNVIQVTYKNNDAAIAAAVVNLLVELFLRPAPRGFQKSGIV